MTPRPPAPVLQDALAFLQDLAISGTEPPDAREQLHELRDRHPEQRVRLVWQREAYDGSVDYDLLLGQPDGGTVSVSYSPPGGLPWSLRGGQRVDDRVVLTVNGTAMEVGQVIACLDFLWDEEALTERLVAACLVQEELAADPVQLSDAELQEAMDAFRRARGLLTASATREWMDRYCLSHRDLEEMVAGEAAIARLRRRVAAPRLREWFARHRADLAVAHITRLCFVEAAQARRFLSAVRAGGDVARLTDRAAVSATLAPTSELVRVVRRADLAPHVAEEVFTAAPGAVLGPYEAGHVVLRMLAVEPATLDDDTIDAVERRIFAEWLSERRRTARVEWHWGAADRTAGDSAARTGLHGVGAP